MKKIKVFQDCVLTKSDGTLALVSGVKEAFTTMHSNDVNITVSLKDISKEEAEKYLNEQKVPFDEITECPKDMPQYDAVICKADSYVHFWSSWQNTIGDVALRLFDEQKREDKTAQEKMNDEWNEYIKMTKKQNEEMDKPHHANSISINLD